MSFTYKLKIYLFYLRMNRVFSAAVVSFVIKSFFKFFVGEKPNTFKSKYNIQKVNVMNTNCNFVSYAFISARVFIITLIELLIPFFLLLIKNVSLCHPKNLLESIDMILPLFDTSKHQYQKMILYEFQ